MELCQLVKLLNRGLDILAGLILENITVRQSIITTMELMLVVAVAIQVCLAPVKVILLINPERENMAIMTTSLER